MSTKLRISSRFWVTPNSLLNNPEITLRSKGLYGFIQAKPDGWDFSSERIAGESKDGRDSVRAGLKELEEFGYLERKKTSLGRGQFEVEYILYDIPQFKAKKEELSGTDIPSSIDDRDAELSGTDITTTIIPSINKEINTKKEETKKEDILAFWNSKKIIEHKNTPGIEKDIAKARKSFSDEEIKTGIENYSIIISSARTFFHYKWTLSEFLSRDKWLAVFLYKTEKDYLKDKNQVFTSAADEIKKSDAAKVRSDQIKKAEDQEVEKARQEKRKILNWFDRECTPAVREIIKKTIEENPMMTGLSRPIEGDSDEEIMRKNNLIESTRRLLTPAVIKRYLESTK